MTKLKKAARKRASAKPAAQAAPPSPAPIASEPKKKRRRRRRRRSQQLLSARLITEVNQKKRAFLRDVSGMLTDALGFEVRVTLVKPRIEMTPDMRRASRMTKKQAARQIVESFAPVTPAQVGKGRSFKVKKIAGLNDAIPF